FGNIAAESQVFSLCGGVLPWSTVGLGQMTVPNAINAHVYPLAQVVAARPPFTLTVTARRRARAAYTLHPFSLTFGLYGRPGAVCHWHQHSAGTRFLWRGIPHHH